VRKAKVLTPEESEAKRIKSVEWHREWRKNHPKEQQAIMDRYYKKKADEAEARIKEEVGN